MKRKLDQNDEAVPAPAAEAQQKAEATVAETKPETSSAEAEPSWADLGLDLRLVQAVALQTFEKPTPVQRKAIPLALNGSDVMAKAPCGSGKTAAFVLPVISSILSRKAVSRLDIRTLTVVDTFKAEPDRLIQQEKSPSYTAAIILAPTRELAAQITRDVEKFIAFCAKDIQVANLTDKHADAVRSILATSPDVVISTPAAAAQQVSAGALSLEKLAYLVLDEARAWHGWYPRRRR
jgi:ATP-dependent RNA helicase DDX56/DBP9